MNPFAIQKRAVFAVVISNHVIGIFRVNEGMVAGRKRVLDRDIVVSRPAERNFLSLEDKLEEFPLFWIHKQSWHLSEQPDYMPKKNGFQEVSDFSKTSIIFS